MTAGAPERGQDAVELAALLALTADRAGAGGTDGAGGPVRTVRYGARPDQLVELHGPGDPAVVLLHGGFWRAAVDRSYLAPLARALAARGVPVAVPEYRRVGAGGGWPATYHDIAAGLAALPGDRPVLLVGHSAGGQLALCAADQPRVGAVLGVAAVSDLALAGELDLGRGAVPAFLDADADADADGPAGPVPEPDPALRPRPPVPVTLLHGTADGQVPAELSRRYAERHGAALELLPGVGHYAPFVPATAAGARLLSRLAGHPR
ncbi:alpha/beta fold hydrolase [Streptomyces sp. DSM 44915]|uniref:Alpha/beta fold hydrolase n=1 Tax=Streptomyces chisholmiae TaxID=3075540 RepID=A0ABU2JZ43_9ACTN|nr:alpha/beta fold hydrolase [Streptomyces sp. DSM 44915]MDT0270112.1 alpha/beta fold hydrolase [Streptomyces sp. DSM 44915]